MADGHAVQHQSDQPKGMQYNFFQVKMAPQGRISIQGTM